MTYHHGYLPGVNHMVVKGHEYRMGKKTRGESYCLDCAKRQSKEFRADPNNKAKIKENWASWYDENRDANIAKSMGRIAADPIRHAAYHKKACKKYVQANPEVYRLAWSKHRALKVNADINDLTVVQWESLKSLYNGCAYNGTVYQSRNCTNMGTTQDHVIPLSKGGNHTFTNVVPACQPCNSKKGTKTWAPRLITEVGN